MKSEIIATMAAVTIGFGASAYGQIDQTKTEEEQIEEALSALPDSMREDVAVRGFDASGNPVLLREGSSAIECRADDPNVRAWSVTCYPPSLKAFVARSEALIKNGADTPERVKTLKREIDSGALTMPTFGSLYLRAGNSVANASSVVIVHVPNANAEDVGLPSLPTRGAPWMAESGTSMAHIRISRR